MTNYWVYSSTYIYTKFSGAIVGSAVTDDVGAVLKSPGGEKEPKSV
jgi:hypothetical protein